MSGSEDRKAHGPEGGDVTSLHLGRARRGEQESLAWVVNHFTPFLRVQARYRIEGGMRRLLDPDDLVDEVWVTVLPRLPDLKARDGHWTPVLLKFLATTLLNKVSNHLTRYLRAQAHSAAPASGSGAGRTTIVGRQPSPATSVLGAVARNEASGMLRAALEELEPGERELLVLRGIEQHSGKDVARRLGVEPSTVTRRYQRLLAKLRARLAGSILDELPA